MHITYWLYQKKASQGTVADLATVTVIARKQSLQYYTLLILLTESKLIYQELSPGSIKM